MDRSSSSFSDYGQIGLFLAMVSKIDGLWWFLKPIMLVVFVVVTCRSLYPPPISLLLTRLTLLSALFYHCQVQLFMDRWGLSCICVQDQVLGVDSWIHLREFYL